MILNSRCAKIKINNTEIFTVFYYGTIEGLLCEFCSDLIIMERVFTMKSSVIKDGVSTAPQRSLLNALGLTEEEIKKPFIGIVSSKNDIVPGHMNIDKIVDAVKQGVALAGGVPIVFPAIAVCDGIAMGHEGMKYSLVTRELIADSTEAMAKAHAFDALVMVPNCDKNVPGMLMAAARINVPTVFVSGGPMLAGHVKGKKTSLSSMFEAVGGPIALVKEGDMIEIDIPANTIKLLVSDEELAKRKAEWKPRQPKITTGYLARYAKLVTSGAQGAVLE